MTDWAARPPEVNTALLQTGPNSAPMLAAAAAFDALAAELDAQGAVMGSAIAEAAAIWEGVAAIRSASAAVKMPAWLAEAAAHAAERAARATAQATAYDAAFEATPQLPEIAQNHTTHAILEATNFFGINTIPIGLNEADYARMWAQAASVMTAYLMETMTNLSALTPVIPPMPITIPGAAEATMASAGFRALAGSPETIARDATFSTNNAASVLSAAKLAAGDVGSTGNDAERTGEQTALATSQLVAQDATTNDTSQATTAEQTMMTVPQTVSQFATQAGELPENALSTPTQGITQAMSPMSAMSSLFSGSGWGTDATGTPISQVGMFGLNPESNHPLAGGTGAPIGAGMLAGGGVPGSAGTSARTPLLASLTTTPAAAKELTVEPAAAAPEQAATRAGAAPMGMMPAGAAHGQRSATATVDPPPAAPHPLTFDNDVDVDIDDWG